MARLFDDSSLATAAHILTKGPVARADIARSLELSPATLTRLVRPLVSRSLVHETSSGMSPTGMGRPTQLLEVPADKQTFVGINLTGSDIHVVHTNTHAEILDALTQPIPSTDVSECAAEIRHLINTVAPGATAAAISLGGQVDGTVVRSSRFLGWDNIDLARELDLAIPLTVINDVSGLTMLELWFGLGRECEDFLIVTVGAGIGHGMVHGLRAVRSPLRGLGMTAHIPLAGAHGVCQYGHIGCANGALTVPAVISRARSGRAIVDDDGRPASAGGPLPFGSALPRLTNSSLWLKTVTRPASVPSGNLPRTLRSMCRQWHQPPSCVMLFWTGKVCACWRHRGRTISSVN